jgi:hypothetical protein
MRATNAQAPEKFDSMIPEVQQFLDTDEESLALQERMKLGQEALTARESAERQRVLERLDVPRWSDLMQARPRPSFWYLPHRTYILNLYMISEV